MSLSSRFWIPLWAASVFASPAAAQARPEAKPKLTPRDAFFSVGPEPVDHKTGAKVIKASAGPSIGVQYILRKRVDGELLDVSPDAVFRRDDRIAFAVRSNVSGYMYIANKLSSGVWKTMFPSPETQGGDNHVEALKWYDMPPGYQFVFEDPPGVEEVFVLFSRERVRDLETLWQTPKAPRPGAKAVDDPPRLMAGTIPNSMVKQLRSLSTRDLRIEKIDNDTPAPGKEKEKAVYIVNPTGRSDSRVWADLRLVHK
jgi:hypothetical protein